MIDAIQASAISNVAGNKTSGSNQLTMDDFLSLMVAQLSNQDMHNTVDDAQFMAQMAQFSMTQAMTELSKITTAAYQVSTAAYSVNLIGKEVTIYETNSDGTTILQKGTIEGVNLLNESAEVIMNGKTYPIANVVSVRDRAVIAPAMIEPEAIEPEIIEPEIMQAIEPEEGVGTSE